MSAQTIHPSEGPRVPAIPHTINAIGEALSGTKRGRFFAEVLAAEQGEQLDTVMRRWWMDAMLDQAPGREERYDNAVAGRNLVAVEHLMQARGIGA